MAVSVRKETATQVKEPEMYIRYYISSADLSAEKFAKSIRDHWHVENRLHWCLDAAKSGNGQRVSGYSPCRVRGFVILPWIHRFPFHGLRNP